MNLELILGIIGSITGTIACFLEYKNYKRNKAKLKVIKSGLDSFMIRESDITSCYSAGLSLTIVNQSNLPISIYSFELTEKNRNNSRQYQTIGFIDGSEKYIEEINTIKKKVDKYHIRFNFKRKNLNPILNLDSFASTNGIIIFPIVYKKPMSSSLILKVKTSRGTFRYYMEIDNFYI